MKLNITYCRKIGLPEYSSAGATCGVEIDVPDVLLLSPDRDAFACQVRAAYDACRAAVDDELGRVEHANEQPQRPEPEPAPPPDRRSQPANGNGYNGRNNGGGWGPTNGNGNGNSGRSNGNLGGRYDHAGTGNPNAVSYPAEDGGRAAANRRGKVGEFTPTTGSQLLGWMRSIGQQPGGVDFKNQIIAWGKRQRIQGRVMDWEPYEIADAVAEVKRLCDELRERNGGN